MNIKMCIQAKCVFISVIMIFDKLRKNVMVMKKFTSMPLPTSHTYYTYIFHSFFTILLIRKYDSHGVR